MKMSLQVENTICKKQSMLLKDRFPQMALEVDPFNNPTIDIDKLTCCENTKVMWRCSRDPCGCHSWCVSVYSRTRHKSGCPYCSRNKTCKHDSFMNIKKLRDEFDYDLNPGINPYLISAKSTRIITWKCSTSECECHIWKLSVVSKTRNRGNCPFCSGKKSCKHSDTMIPLEILNEFDKSLNPDIDIKTLSVKSSIKIKWKCTLKCKCHKWEESLCSKIKYKTKCPYCEHKIGCKHTTIMNDPLLSKEFCQELNPKIDPLKLSIYARTAIMWVCSANKRGCHIWKSSVVNRSPCIHCK